jgi:branched-chain amino acid transport system permease protein
LAAGTQPGKLMQFWLIQTLNSLALGGTLFLLSAGFSLIFGLMRVPNLAHGALFMLGAYVGASLLGEQMNFWLAALLSGVAVGTLGVAMERLMMRRLAGNEQGQVLVTLGVAFIIADLCLVGWGGEPVPLSPPAALRMPLRLYGFVFPSYRLAVVAVALLVAAILYVVMERTRLGAMIRAGVDDREMARGVGIPVSSLFTAVFFLGAGLAGIGGVIGGPIFSAYPGLDSDMLPLALVVVILGGIGSLVGALLGSFIIGFIYNFGTALFPDLAYVVLFLPMVLALMFKPEGLFGRRVLR